jgi:hypothetical protein
MRLQYRFDCKNGGKRGVEISARKRCGLENTNFVEGWKCKSGSGTAALQEEKLEKSRRARRLALRYKSELKMIVRTERFIVRKALA